MNSKLDFWKIFRQFYDDNEQGGSSRWLVAPNTVENSIRQLLAQRNREIANKLIKEFDFGGQFFHGGNHSRLPVIRQLKKELKNYIETN